MVTLRSPYWTLTSTMETAPRRYSTKTKSSTPPFINGLIIQALALLRKLGAEKARDTQSTSPFRLELRTRATITPWTRLCSLCLKHLNQKSFSSPPAMTATSQTPLAGSLYHPTYISGSQERLKGLQQRLSLLL